MRDAKEACRILERRYEAEGLTPVRWKGRPSKVACRGCGDNTVGPWTLCVMSSKIPERREVLIFAASLCRKCIGNEDRQDDVAEAMVQEYLADNKR